MDLRPPLYPLMQPWTILRWCSAALLLAMLALGDGYALILASRRFGAYGLLAVTGSTALAPLLIAATLYRTEVNAARSEIAAGSYPASHYRRMATLLCASGLLLLPGIVSDAIGILLLVRPIGWLVGMLLERRFRNRLTELYEHARADS